MSHLYEFKYLCLTRMRSLRQVLDTGYSSMHVNNASAAWEMFITSVSEQSALTKRFFKDNAMCNLQCASNLSNSGLFRSRFITTFKVREKNCNTRRIVLSRKTDEKKHCSNGLHATWIKRMSYKCNICPEKKLDILQAVFIWNYKSASRISKELLRRLHLLNHL